MGKKNKRPAWFKLWLHHRPLLEAVEDAVVGRAVKAALEYLDTGAHRPLGTLEAVVFATIRADVEEASADYQRSVANGKKGGRPKPTEEASVGEGYPPLSGVTEGEREEEREREGEEEREGEGISAAKPPRPRFVPPTLQQLQDYCREKGYAVDPQRFLDYYTSIGWKIGKNSMKDWKAAVRTWNRKEQPDAKSQPKDTWTFGTVL